MVVVFHISSNVNLIPIQLQYVMWLQGGVDLFFVISGFVMVQSTMNRSVAPMQFMAQRALRIVPMYWIATFALMPQIEGEWAFKIKSLLFVPAVHPHSNLVQPVLDPGWTLNYEMFFYAIFAVFLCVKESRRFAGTALLFAGLVWAGLSGGLTHEFDYYTQPIILEFIFGMAIARFGIRLPFIVVPLAIAAMIALQTSSVDRIFALGIPAALVVAGLLGIEKRVPDWRAANFLGSASYSIYLFHLIAIGFLVKFWPDIGSGPVLFTFVAFGFSILVGGSVYFALERPLLTLTSQLGRKQQGHRLFNA